MSILKNINYETRGLNPFRAEVFNRIPMKKYFLTTLVIVEVR
tara:strand:- start:312 stop:437 length:126 start_codon:yes stop_codon:yes gene_type:complete